MGTKHGLSALALVAAVAATGWALQVPEAGALGTTRPAVPRATTSVEAPAPSLSVLAWPQAAVEPDSGTPARAHAGDTVEVEIGGLEEMAATGAASPQR